MQLNIKILLFRSPGPGIQLPGMNSSKLNFFFFWVRLQNLILHTQVNNGAQIWFHNTEFHDFFFFFFFFSFEQNNWPFWISHADYLISNSRKQILLACYIKLASYCWPHQEAASIHQHHQLDTAIPQAISKK